MRKTGSQPFLCPWTPVTVPQHLQLKQMESQFSILMTRHAPLPIIQYLINTMDSGTNFCVASTNHLIRRTARAYWRIWVLCSTHARRLLLSQRSETAAVSWPAGLCHVPDRQDSVRLTLWQRPTSLSPPGQEGSAAGGGHSKILAWDTHCCRRSPETAHVTHTPRRN